MKLSQLYANKSFKDIVFNDGLNLVLAKVTKELDVSKDSHCLGKTTLIEVLDFMLLAKVEKKSIFKKHKNQFKGYELYLEILLNSGEYLTIKRTVNNSSKISFKTSKIKSRLLNNEVWDKTNIAFDQAKTLLNEYLGFDVLTNWPYRKSITYFLRSQKDYNDVFQLSKFKGKHEDWKPFVFDLLGFNGDSLKKKYDEENNIAAVTTTINSIKKEFSVDPKEIDKIKGAINLKKEDKKALQEKIDNFNFYQQERNLNRELVEDIERKISELNTSEYNLKYDLDKTQQSFSQNISFDIEQLKQLYNETQIFFPDNLVKDYKALEEFNKKITEERNKYLEDKIETLTRDLKKVRISLQEYDNKRSEMLSVLQDKDSFRKFKSYQTNLSQIESEILRLEEKLKNIDKIADLGDQKDDLQENLDSITKEIKEQINSNNNKIYHEVRRVFSNTFKYIINTPAILYIEQNKQGNIEFKVEVTRENEIDITAEGKGNTYKKILCVSFDLSVLEAYSKNSFYRFVYHDGVFEGLDNRKKSNFIELVRRYCTDYNIQYIFSSIEHDIPKDILNAFTKEEICLTLDDSGDNGKLFEFSF